MEWPAGKYGAILADPPWRFETWSAKGRGKSPDRHYTVQSLDDIKSLPVASLADNDCALFLWAIDAMLPQAFDLIATWGFTYKTVAFTWAKAGKWSDVYPIGTGYWTRANPEQCLLATRGKPRRLNADVRQLVIAQRREHSRKPDRIHSDIERLVPGPYVELFARSTRPGWACWGNETTKFEVTA